MFHPEIFQPEEIQEIPGVLRIGVDLDANVDDIDTWTCRLVKRGLGVDIKSVLEQRPVNFWLDEWPEIKAIPHGPAFVNQLFSRTFIYENAIPIKGAIETINSWRKQEHEIWFITARSKDSLGQVTLDWLEKHELGWAKDKILFSEGERVDFKAQQAEMLDLHVFIEDHAKQ